MSADPERLGVAGLYERDLDEVVERAAQSLSALRNASVFVTGGTGFIGRWLLASLLQADARLGLGLRLTVLTRDAERYNRVAPDVSAQVTLLEGDVRYFTFPSSAFSHVIHAATDTSAEAVSRSSEILDTIVNGTRRTFELARTSGARRVLLVSSGAVYGPLPDGPGVDEAYLGAPPTGEDGSAYGQGKRVAEQLATAARGDGLETCVARAFAFVGPGLPMRAHFAIGNFIADAVAGGEIVVNGDGTPTRSYLYAGDLAVWLLRLLTHGTPGRAYNVGSDRAISVGELARLVARVVPGARGVRILRNAEEGPRRRYVPSIERARAELDLDAWTPLEEAIVRTAAFGRLG